MTARLGVTDWLCPEVLWKQVVNDLLKDLDTFKETHSVLFQTVLWVKQSISGCLLRTAEK